MDVRMPGMSGFECARQLKGLSPHLFIIMFSGLTQPDSDSRTREAGAGGCLRKPFAVGRLIEMLPVYLRQREPLSASNQCAAAAIGGTARQSELIDQPALLGTLCRMVSSIEQDFHAREDLLQEALIHFWSQRQHHPGQRLSWYLQSVNFCLKDLWKSGRSLDSPKRRAAQAIFGDQGGDANAWLDNFQFDDGIMSSVNARDVVSLLMTRLTPIDQGILDELAQGLGIRDIALRLGISHQSVIRRRERIAQLAVQIGVLPPHARTKSDDADAR